jgi:hypothetical protein
MCRHNLLTLFFFSLSTFNWFLRSGNKLIQVVAGSVMEGDSMMFHGGYKKRCLLTILVSQIQLRSQPQQKDFSLHYL